MPPNLQTDERGFTAEEVSPAQLHPAQSRTPYKIENIPGTPSYSDSDEGLFDGPDLAPVRKKRGLNQEIENVKAQSPPKTAPPVSVEESLPLTVTDTQSAARNYVDCTESNDEDEDGEVEKEEEEQEEEEVGKGDTNVMKEEEVNRPAKESETNKETEKKETEVEGPAASDPPKWEDFFTTETLTDSQNSLNSHNSLSSQLQSGCSVPSPSLSRLTGSQTPELFSDAGEEEETPNNDENFSLSLSASLSNHSSQNLDSNLPDTLILHPAQEGREQGDVRTNTVSQEKESNDQNVQSEVEELSESQVSSDFDIPCTPESKTPRPDELLQLYRKLAAGEEMIIRKRD